MQRLTRAVIGLGSAAMLAACGTEQPPVPPLAPTSSVEAGNTSPTDGSVFVRYELNGTAVNFDGFYSEPSGQTERMVELRSTPLPWSKSFTLPPRQLFVAGLVAQAPNLESLITCRIVRDGAVIAEQTGPTVDCRAEIG